MVGRSEVTPQDGEYRNNGNGRTLGTLAHPRENINNIYPITPEMIAVLSLPPKKEERDSQKELIYQFALKRLYEMLRQAGISKPEVDFATFQLQSRKSVFLMEKIIYSGKEYDVVETVFITSGKILSKQNKLDQIERIDKEITKEEAKIGLSSQPSENLLKLRAVRSAIVKAMNAQENLEIVIYRVHLLSLFTAAPLVEYETRAVRTGTNGGGLQTSPTTEESLSVYDQLSLKPATEPTVSSARIGSLASKSITSGEGDVANLVNSEPTKITQQPVGEVRRVGSNPSTDGHNFIPVGERKIAIPDNHFLVPNHSVGRRIPVMKPKDPETNPTFWDDGLKRLRDALAWIFS